MSPKRWLPTVIRARQALEDQQAQQVAVARRDAERAAEHLVEVTERVDGLSLPASMSVADFHAELANQQAGLASLAAATHRLAFAENRLRTELAELSEAAKARRTVEKMHERLTDELAAEALATAQREQDEVALTRHVRAVAG